jgi:hypothetical protein
MEDSNDSLKQLILITGVSLLIFWIFKPKGDGEGKSIFSSSSGRKIIRKPILSEDDLQDDYLRSAYECLCAYIDAYNEQESDKVLIEMKDDFKTDIGIVIYEDANGKLAVRDTEGNDILVNN